MFWTYTGWLPGVATTGRGAPPRLQVVAPIEYDAEPTGLETAPRCGTCMSEIAASGSWASAADPAQRAIAAADSSDGHRVVMAQPPLFTPAPHPRPSAKTRPSDDQSLPRPRRGPTVFPIQDGGRRGGRGGGGGGAAGEPGGQPGGGGGGRNPGGGEARAGARSGQGGGWR